MSSQTALFPTSIESATASAITCVDLATGWSMVCSPCRRFRYLLHRPVISGTRTRGRILWVLMNPSTANEVRNDRTASKCMKFSSTWGFADIEIVNTFGLRSSNPKDLVAELQAGGNPIGPENDSYIIEAAQRADFVLFGCGVPPFGKRAPAELRDRPRAVFELLRRYTSEIHALRVTKTGNPEHPLYLGNDTTPTLFHGWSEDDQIQGYTLALPLGEAALPEDAPFDEQYPYEPAESAVLADGDTSTVELAHARVWPTVAPALAFRAHSELFKDAEVKVVRGGGRAGWGRYARPLPPPLPVFDGLGQ